jgi:hypothetical protein
MEIIIGIVSGLVLGLIVGLVIGQVNGKKSIIVKVKQILKQENIAINLDQMLDKKNAGKIKEDFFEIPTS